MGELGGPSAAWEPPGVKARKLAACMDVKTTRSPRPTSCAETATMARSRFGAVNIRPNNDSRSGTLQRTGGELARSWSQPGGFGFDGPLGPGQPRGFELGTRSLDVNEPSAAASTNRGGFGARSGLYTPSMTSGREISS